MSQSYKNIDVKTILAASDKYQDKVITIKGWVKTIRASKNIGFIELNDGTSFPNIQVVFAAEQIDNFTAIAKENVGAALTVTGTLVLTPAAKQACYIQDTYIRVVANSTPYYPLKKKRHTLEYLRTIQHLRPRTNTLAAVFRVRSALALAIHNFFHAQGFIYVHTPIITGSDCEGAGETFRVTTLPADEPPRRDDGTVDFSQDFFSRSTNLTVSGQLEAECLALAFAKVYTFGPTFRAENSNTQRHAAEFWMIEPEIAFADLQDDMDLAENLIKYVLQAILAECPEEMQFFNNFYDQGLLERLNQIIKADFAKITYTEAIELLVKATKDFEYTPEWGLDLQTEHERYLTEEVFKKPLFVTDYPKGIKAFYMRRNDDGKTVAAMDLLVPGVGEIIGGSQREERWEILKSALEEGNLDPQEYSWYLDLRRYGGAPHAGFGLGFERLLMYVTGVSNIRDVIPFPRTAGSAEF